MTNDGNEKTLREGYTTGSCAAAATKAALTALITGQVQAEATIRIPIGRVVTFSLASCSFDGETATASVVKDGGDDPDATHGALIVSTVSWASSPGVISTAVKGSDVSRNPACRCRSGKRRSIQCRGK